MTFLLLNVCPVDTQNHYDTTSSIFKSDWFLNSTHPKTNKIIEESNSKSRGNKRGVRLIENTKVAEEAKQLVTLVDEGLQIFEPELADEGEGGTYFLKNKEGRRIAVFKPFDEQPQAENNPKKRSNQSPCLPEAFTGIKLEETHRNEVAAYLLDHDCFAGVPLTVLVECTHYIFNSKHRNRTSPSKTGSGARRRSSTSPSPPSPSFLPSASDLIFTTKTGSLQKYIDYEAQSWDVGPSLYPVREVHRIGLLDIRILNLDRHGGNMLVISGESDSFPDWVDSEEDEEEKNYHLVPIDHAFSLPDCNRLNCSDLWFEWYNWSQTSHPFSEETLHYIEKIDIEADIDLLLGLQIRRECIETMILTTSLLKFTALKMKKSLKEIARLIIRENPKKLSALELINFHVQQERFPKDFAYFSEPKKLASRSTTDIPMVSTVFPPRFIKSRSTSKLPPCKIPDEGSVRFSRSPNRPNRNQSGRVPTQPLEVRKRISYDMDGISGPHNEREDLRKFVQLVQHVIETTLPDIVSELPKSDDRFKKTPSMSNEMYLQQLIEGKLKL